MPMHAVIEILEAGVPVGYMGRPGLAASHPGQPAYASYPVVALPEDAMTFATPAAAEGFAELFLRARPGTTLRGVEVG